MNMGKQNNQTFCNIPFLKLVNYLKYKCLMCGINVILTEESYTSKCDNLNLESMEHHDNYDGKRTKRGLFKSLTGKLINADVNGSLGIMRKVIGDSSIKKIINSGFLFNPLKVNILSLRKDFVNTF